jgi:hypothetical protein
MSVRATIAIPSAAAGQAFSFLIAILFLHKITECIPSYLYSIYCLCFQHETKKPHGFTARKVLASDAAMGPITSLSAQYDRCEDGFQLVISPPRHIPFSAC